MVYKKKKNQPVSHLRFHATKTRTQIERALFCRHKQTTKKAI